MKKEKYRLTVFGWLFSEGLSEEKALKILNEIELEGRRMGYKNPCILLKGKYSELIDVKKGE